MKDFTKYIVGTELRLPKGLKSIQYDTIQFTSDDVFFDTIVIPSGVKEIGDGAFEGMIDVKTVIIPTSVTEIGACAFWGCENLEGIHIPSNIRHIGEGAFTNCPSLSIIEVPNSKYYSSVGNCLLSKDKETLLYGCKNSIIPDTVHTIEERAFFACSDLVNIEIPTSVYWIKDSAFALCTSLENIDIPASVQKIGSEAFWGCKKLTLISIPESVKEVGKGFCSHCENLSGIYVSPYNEYYSSKGNCLLSKSGSILIQGCKNSFIPDSVTEIADKAFEGMSGLEHIDIPDSVAVIGWNAFSACGIQTVRLPESLIVIRSCAFSFCVSLAEINIPNGVRIIRPFTFSHCSSLSLVHISDGVTLFGEGAFNECKSLSQLSLPGTLEWIEEDTFNGCDLKDVSFPVSVLPRVADSIEKESFSKVETYHLIASQNVSLTFSTLEESDFRLCSKTILHVPKGYLDIYLNHNKMANYNFMAVIDDEQ